MAKKLKPIPFTKYRAYKGQALAVNIGTNCIILADSKESLVEIWARLDMQKPIKLESCHPAILMVDVPDSGK